LQRVPQPFGNLIPGRLNPNVKLLLSPARF
jgi:hypothetical protein